MDFGGNKIVNLYKSKKKLFSLNISRWVDLFEPKARQIQTDFKADASHTNAAVRMKHIRKFVIMISEHTDRQK